MDHGRAGRNYVYRGKWPDYVLSKPTGPVRRLSMLRVLHHMIDKPETMREALQALIFYADQAAPDMPDTARVENLAYALDRAREALERDQ